MMVNLFNHIIIIINYHYIIFLTQYFNKYRGHTFESLNAMTLFYTCHHTILHVKDK